MKVTIIRAENHVYIDGRGFIVDCSSVDPSISVVQWDTSAGHIEYANDTILAPGNFKVNTAIDSIAPWQALINTALAAKTAADAPPPPMPLSDYATMVRSAKEIGGFVSQNFGPVLTDRETVAILGQLIQSLDKGILVEPINYKSPNGFVSLSKVQVTAIATEVAQFVQGCFNTEKTVQDGIAAKTITTKQQVDAAFA